MKKSVQIEGLVSDAVSKGAKVVCGGKRGNDSNIFEPTVIVDVQMNMDIAHTEIFGPVASVIRSDLYGKYKIFWVFMC